MASIHDSAARWTAVLLIGASIAGCSGSGGSDVDEASTPTTEAIDPDTNGLPVDSGDDVVDGALDDPSPEPTDVTVGSGDEGSPDGPAEEPATEPADEIDGASDEAPPTSNVDASDRPSTRVDFDITVPAYRSNALQVRLEWGEKTLTASWIEDETWSASDDFPTNTTHPLVATFLDDDGAVTLGTHEAELETGDGPSESYRIAADQFDTDRWDDDGDGTSNLDESIAASETPDPAPAETLLPVEASVELRADKTFRIRWERSAADYYRVLENPDGVSGYTAITGRLDASTDRHDHRVALHERVNARYIVEACNADDCTLSVQQLIEGSLAEAVGYFKAASTGPNDQFGSSVSLSADGRTLAVGAPTENGAAAGVNGDQNDDSAIGSGAVYVFVRVDGSWRQQAYVKASNPETLDRFGEDVSLSADGGTLAVGATDERSLATGVDGDQSDNSAGKAGAVYVFVRSGESWRQQAYLKASNTQPGESYGFEQRFGSAVSLSADGDTLAVGATGEDSDSTGVNGDQTQTGELSSIAIQRGIDSGAVYVFARGGDGWRQQAYLKTAEGRSRRFGRAVSLSGTGDTLAVALFDPVTEATPFMFRGADAADFHGAVQMFSRAGDVWESGPLIRPETDPWDGFGHEVGLSGDGETLAVSGDDVVYVFDRIGDDWREQASVRASNADRGDLFGRSMALSADGDTLVVGAEREDSAATGLQGYQGDEVSNEESGAAYVFTRGDGSWSQRAYVKASNSRELIGFGRAIGLSADGGTLAIGAPQEGNPTGGIGGDQGYETFSRTGAVYLY